MSPFFLKKKTHPLSVHNAQHLYIPGNRRSLSCSKQEFMSLCTTLKNVFMFQSEHNFFAIVAMYKRIV